MHWTDPVVLIAALGGGAGIGSVIRAVATVVGKLRAGVSPREGKRRVDIVLQRDEALRDLARERERADEQQARADEAQARADWAEENRQRAVANEQRAREHAGELRVLLLESASLSREQLPEWPDMDRTIPRAEFDRMRRSRGGRH
ncbi:hypothetical protein [Curtobacterium sp. MCBD17_003]|uniref:hypothetical protein n=1 Tax=Curtobacterium sp. MCBD17_003 TaxID=2175667 RepID=UPI000DAA3C81|nr:hypothetical protein [Curtobacterium sp. MCBD17_003]WIE54239.1 hypothetical protein DEI88_014110 [Curtobacterium sp. MCBD17_003]